MSTQLQRSLLALGVLASAITCPAMAEEGAPLLSSVAVEIAQAGASQPLLPQVNAQNSQQTAPIQITQVQFSGTPTGIAILLEAAGVLSPATTSTLGNTLILEIPNAVLALSDRQDVQAVNPAEGLSQLSVTQVDRERVQVAITGIDAPSTADVRTTGQSIVISAAPASGAAEIPDTTPALEATEPSTEPSAEASTEEDTEIVITGQQRSDYAPVDATTATRTNTAIRDIPQSIQVIPQQVLEDRQVTELREALETQAGISSSAARGTSAFGEGFKIRGFSVLGGGLLRDGIPYFSFGSLDTSDIERIEVLRGPASVLFGAGEPGGVINLVSKQPLAEPFSAASVTVGSFGTYRGSVDFSGPLNEDKTVRYRLNASYENYGSFRDFVNGERWSISPTLAWDLGPDTSLNLYGQFISERETIDEGIPDSALGVANVPRNQFFNEPFGKFEQTQFTLGYALNHQLSSDWSIRHALQYLQYKPVRFGPLFDTFDPATGELTRLEYATDGTYQRFFTNAEVVGEFSTGTIQHRLLFGTEYRSNLENPRFQVDNAYRSINVFNPVYTRTPYAFAPTFFRDDNVNGWSVYLQDQIEFLPNLKVLAGLRYDTFSQFRTTQVLGNPRREFEQTDSALTPRLGIVYQPIEPLSFYASYSRSFAPNFAASRNNGLPFDPQTGEQLEIGVKADLTERLSLTLAAFDLKRQNLTTRDPNNILLSVQTGEQTSRGVELNLAGEILPGWNMTASYTYLDAFVSRDNRTPVGNRLPNVPENQFSLWTTYDIQAGDLEGLGFGLGLFYVGDRPRDLDNTYTLSSYFRTDAALFYRRDNWRAQLNIENLLDINYIRSGNYDFAGGGVNPGKPLAVSASFAIEF